MCEREMDKVIKGERVDLKEMMTSFVVFDMRDYQSF